MLMMLSPMPNGSAAEQERPTDCRARRNGNMRRAEKAFRLRLDFGEMIALLPANMRMSPTMKIGVLWRAVPFGATRKRHQADFFPALIHGIKGMQTPHRWAGLNRTITAYSTCLAM